MKNDEVSDRPLRRGYTTGACAAAAAKAATLALMSGVPMFRVEILLPAGFPLVLPVTTREQDESHAVCSVVKDAGDDPDVTHGAEIVVSVERGGKLDRKGHEISVVGGPGVGRVTKPGLPVPVGEWAINPVPLSMIRNEVGEVLKRFGTKSRRQAFRVTVQVPKGEELAPKTLNPRLGIMGGISILGTTGIVEPVSAKAWEDTVAAQINVAVACGNTTVVLTPGRQSEKVAESLFPNLPEECFIQMGDYVGSSLRRSAEKGIEEVVVAAMPGKMVKIAMGFEHTHARSSDLKFNLLADWAGACRVSDELVRRIREANTAREIWEFLPKDSPLYAEICRRARTQCEEHSGREVRVRAVLIGYEGEVLADGS